MHQLNELEAFDLMRGYLAAFAHRHPQPDGLNRLLALTNRDEETNTPPSDPTQWEDWLDAITALRERNLERGVAPDTTNILQCVHIWISSLEQTFEKAGLKTVVSQTPPDEPEQGVLFAISLEPVDVILRVWASGHGELEINDAGMVTETSFDELLDPAQLARLLGRVADRAHAMIAHVKSKDERRGMFE